MLSIAYPKAPDVESVFVCVPVVLPTFGTGFQNCNLAVYACCWFYAPGTFGEIITQSGGVWVGVGAFYAVFFVF